MKILERLRRHPEQDSPFLVQTRRELRFLQEQHGYELADWEPYPHAEEIITYKRGPSEVRLHLGDSRTGITVDVLTPDGRWEELCVQDWLHREGVPWSAETKRLLHEYAELLEARADELLAEAAGAGAPREPALDPVRVSRVVEEAFAFLSREHGFRRLATQHAADVVLVPFRGRAAGVNVHVTPDRVAVTIGRLDSAGRMRASDREDWRRWWWLLQDLVPAKRVRDDLGRASADVDGLLREHSAALEEHGDAALQGDFTGLADIEWWESRDG
jgi:hypothetical protein